MSTALTTLAAALLLGASAIAQTPPKTQKPMTLTAMDEHHALQAVYNGPGSHTLSRDRLGTRRVMAVFCVMLDDETTLELARGRALQDAIRTQQRARSARPRWSAFHASVAP